MVKNRATITRFYSLMRVAIVYRVQGLQGAGFIGYRVYIGFRVYRV